MARTRRRAHFSANYRTEGDLRAAILSVLKDAARRAGANAATHPEITSPALRIDAISSLVRAPSYLVRDQLVRMAAQGESIATVQRFGEAAYYYVEEGDR